MAGPRHNYDEHAHKDLITSIKTLVSDTVRSLTKLVNDNLGDVKKATNLPVSNTLIKRDEHGRARVSNPEHLQDIANRGWVETFGNFSYQTFTESGTFTSPSSGLGLALTINGGSGGSGGRSGGDTPTDGHTNIAGIQVVQLVKNKQYPVIVGAGGAGGTGSAGVPGSAGGRTSFDGKTIASSGAGVGERLREGFIGTELKLPPVNSEPGKGGNRPFPSPGAPGYGAGGGGGGVSKSGQIYTYHGGGAGAPGVCIIFYNGG